MAARELHARWARLGAGSTGEPSEEKVDLERLLVDSAVVAPGDAELFWKAASWLATHYKLVDTRRLGRFLDDLSGVSSAVAGAMVDVALEQSPAARSLRSARTHCRVLYTPKPLFTATRRTHVSAGVAWKTWLPLFKRWGLRHDQMSLVVDEVQPIHWVMTNCPELRVRALLGADLEAAVLEALFEEPATITDLAKHLDATRAAVHDAVMSLVGRGLLLRPTEGYRREVSVRPAIRDWISDFPALAT
jgi:hypothetical protein